MEQSIKDLIKELNILEIKPNQTLFIKFNELLSHDILDDLQKQLSKYLNCKVVITCKDVDIEVVEVQNENNND